MTTPTTPIQIPQVVAGRLLVLLDRAAKFTGITHECHDIARLIREASSIEAEHGTDHEELLYELLEAVALESGRLVPLTADRSGVDLAKAALADMSPALGATQDSSALHIIRAALSAPRLSYQMVDRAGACVGEVIDCHAFPVEGRALVSPDGTRRRVLAVAEHVGSPTATVMVGDTDGW